MRLVVELDRAQRRSGWTASASVSSRTAVVNGQLVALESQQDRRRYEVVDGAL